MNKEGIMGDNRKGTWEDVTEKCHTRRSGDGDSLYVCGPVAEFVRAILTQYGVTRHCVEGGACDNDNAKGYRVITNGADSIRVEHFTPNPEPVIAYKAVRVEDGKYLSVLMGSDKAPVYATPGRALEYVVGKETSGGTMGIFCFRDIEDCKKTYRARTFYARSSGPIAILEVEATGGEIDVRVSHPIGSVNYPSVKVLSVAWEEEKKEEWVDVTRDCTVRLSGESGEFIVISHNGLTVAEVGHKLWSTTRKDYRVTSRPNEGVPEHAGYFKVEKRNG